MDDECAQALRNYFGYVPDEKDGEKWVVREDTLIVIHHSRRPKLFRRGCSGAYYEIEPLP